MSDLIAAVEPKIKEAMAAFTLEGASPFGERRNDFVEVEDKIKNSEKLSLSGSRILGTTRDALTL